jgi:hypothetical protein
MVLITGSSSGVGKSIAFNILGNAVMTDPEDNQGDQSILPPQTMT